jgi:hypothetical protein
MSDRHRHAGESNEGLLDAATILAALVPGMALLNAGSGL